MLKEQVKKALISGGFSFLSTGGLILLVGQLQSF